MALHQLCICLVVRNWTKCLSHPYHKGTLNSVVKTTTFQSFLWSEMLVHLQSTLLNSNQNLYANIFFEYVGGVKTIPGIYPRGITTINNPWLRAHLLLQQQVHYARRAFLQPPSLHLLHFTYCLHRLMNSRRINFFKTLPTRYCFLPNLIKDLKPEFTVVKIKRGI